MKISVEKKIGSGVLSFETGQLAKQAAACVLVRYNDTVVLNAVTTGKPRAGIDFFPLTCDYRERTAAAGKFPGGFLKREGRPSTKETLTSRLMDRPVRPLFPKGFNDEVQVQAMVVASDKQTDGDILAMNGASVGLLISPLPFQGPVASVRLGRVDGELVPFPTHQELEESDLDLIVSGGRHAVTMIEGFAREMPEAEMAAAIEYAHEIIIEIVDLQEEFAGKVDVQKIDYIPAADDGLDAKLTDLFYDQFKAAKQTEGKLARAEAVSKLKEEAKANIIPDPEAEDAVAEKRFATVWHDLEEKVVRDLILSGTRPDGRDSKTIRPIECHVNVLPCVHGSAIFQRGETQSLMTVALGTGRDEQRVDGLLEEYSKKFMLDYNFPPYSVGECRPIRGPGRREIGHGMLAERSVKPVIPDPEAFPYTIRVISDITESNGSSSMASVCGATLALMAAGVPLTNPVAGISVGMVQESADNWTLLTDILGDEDHFGDMDFKIAGTQNGITGIQLDLKINGIGFDVIRATLKQSREARIDILRNMLRTIPRPNNDIHDAAPRLTTMKIDPEKIGALIGPGGKNIRSIQEQTATVIEVDDTGVVKLACGDKEMLEKAQSMVEACTATVQKGKLYKGTVVSIRDFGCFVEILPGRDGLCHVSELADGYVRNVGEFFKVGDEMDVVVIEVDEQDRIKLSRRAALAETGETDTVVPAESGDDEKEGRSSSSSRGGRSGSSRSERKPAPAASGAENFEDDDFEPVPPADYSDASFAAPGPRQSGGSRGRRDGGRRDGARGDSQRGGSSRGSRGGSDDRQSSGDFAGSEGQGGSYDSMGYGSDRPRGGSGGGRPRSGGSSRGRRSSGGGRSGGGRSDSGRRYR